MFSSQLLFALSHEQLYRMQCLVHAMVTQLITKTCFLLTFLHKHLLLRLSDDSLGFARARKQDTISLFMLEKSCLSCSYINKFIQVLQVSLGGF